MKGTKFRSKEPSAFQVISRWQVFMKRRAGRFPEVLVLCRRLSRFGLPRLSWVLELGWVMVLIGQKQQNPFTTWVCASANVENKPCVHQEAGSCPNKPSKVHTMEVFKKNGNVISQQRREREKKSWKLGHLISPRKWGKPGEDTKS